MSNDRAWTDVDLHVHTLSSNCGYTSHQRLLDLARLEGRRVVAVTDHDSAAGAVAVRDLAARSGDDLLVLVGMELTTSDFGHVILFGRGVEEEWGWRPNEPFPRHIPDHWVAIQAHPFRGKVTLTESG
ncbi:MAG TPA: PHP domain-containing protein, partial [Chloroflexota bacterium]|nr:PHP domain-containing protein [Chloroflexota bacterium]